MWTSLTEYFKIRSAVGRCACSVLSIVLCADSVVAGDVEFEFAEVGALRGFETYVSGSGLGSGVAAADFDDDGDIDIFVPNGSNVADQLYRNLGDGTYEEVAAQVGVDSLKRHRAALWFDYDNDGDLDLVVAGDVFRDFDSAPLPSTLTLYRQERDGTFVDTTVESGLDGVPASTGLTHIGGLAAGDLNGDGLLDLCCTQWHGETHVFLNDAPDGFVEIAEELPLIANTNWQPLIFDFNRDGLGDIYINVDFAPNHLLLAQSDGTFIDAAESAGLDSAWNEMGAALGDFDADGDLDLYTTNIFGSDGFVPMNADRWTRLYRNETIDHAPAFTDVAQEVGVDDTGWGWGCTFLDADMDGVLDIAAVNGAQSLPWLTDPSVFFRNSGPPDFAFESLGSDVRFDDTFLGSAVVAFDSDRDGDLDMLQSCLGEGGLRLLENQRSIDAPSAHYLTVRPRMELLNRRAIGARVTIEFGGVQAARAITAGTSFLGQEPAEAHFGLGDADVVDSVLVDWPDGRRSVRHNVQADQIFFITRYVCPADVTGDSDRVDISDLDEVVRSWGACVECDTCRGDVNGDCVVDVFDILAVLQEWGDCGPQN